MVRKEILSFIVHTDAYKASDLSLWVTCTLSMRCHCACDSRTAVCSVRTETWKSGKTMEIENLTEKAWN